MKYYQLTTRGKFDPLTYAEYVRRRDVQLKYYGVAYVLLLNINGADGVVLAGTKDVRLAQGSTTNILPTYIPI